MFPSLMSQVGYHQNLHGRRREPTSKSYSLTTCVWYMDVYMHAYSQTQKQKKKTKVGRKKEPWSNRSETENGSFLWILYIQGRLSNSPTMSCHFASIGVLHSSGNLMHGRNTLYEARLLYITDCEERWY